MATFTVRRASRDQAVKSQPLPAQPELMPRLAAYSCAPAWLQRPHVLTGYLIGRCQELVGSLQPLSRMPSLHHAGFTI